MFLFFYIQIINVFQKSAVQLHVLFGVYKKGEFPLCNGLVDMSIYDVLAFMVHVGYQHYWLLWFFLEGSWADMHRILLSWCYGFIGS